MKWMKEGRKSDEKKKVTKEMISRSIHFPLASNKDQHGKQIKSRSFKSPAMLRVVDC
jgi:hypothetical protein